MMKEGLGKQISHNVTLIIGVHSTMHLMQQTTIVLAHILSVLDVHVCL